MGRGKILFSNQQMWKGGPLAGDHWHTERNTHIQLAEVGRAETQQCFLWRLCKSHVAYQSPKSVLDKSNNSLDCRVCDVHAPNQQSKPRIPSQYELAAYEAIGSLGMEQLWLVETRVRKRNLSSVDIWLPDLRLLIMVDGEGDLNDAHEVPAEGGGGHEVQCDCN